jgi:RimJ/RimL family protein N-acetyltransferase
MAKWASLPELLGIVAVDNLASCRVLEKAGFVRGDETGTQRIYRYFSRAR